ncbi:hypothetical protein B0T17DRAFT_235305 [Bombardia bombarda]|uniref:F-box domain-containing protein n=1 Tax=Bombardia bombarda TaxID=252184 RepID=A0AA39XBL6_9PEZI|nr:hypothetical protein B0T17DRAFT_235305 [Bombardia bombarda]
MALSLLPRLPSELVVKIFQNCDGCKNAFTLAKTCSRLWNVYQVNKVPILWSISLRSQPALDLALVAVRATKIVNDAYLADNLPRSEDLFPEAAIFKPLADFLFADMDRHGSRMGDAYSDPLLKGNEPDKLPIIRQISQAVWVNNMLDRFITSRWGERRRQRGKLDRWGRGNLELNAQRGDKRFSNVRRTTIIRHGLYRPEEVIMPTNLGAAGKIPSIPRVLDHLCYMGLRRQPVGPWQHRATMIPEHRFFNFMLQEHCGFQMRPFFDAFHGLDVENPTHAQFFDITYYLDFFYHGVKRYIPHKSTVTTAPPFT